MTFIRLSKSIINTRYIKSIEIKDKKYIINTIDHITNGFFIFTYGNTKSYNSKQIICQKEEPEDYNIVQKWIHSINDFPLYHK
jgi:hypothetical protein